MCYNISMLINQRSSAEDKLAYNIRPNGSCIEYIGCVNNHGYCVIKTKGMFWYAHRLAYSMQVGEIPMGMTIDHICFNRRCVNTEHLRILSLQENAKRWRESRVEPNCRKCGSLKKQYPKRLVCVPCASASSLRYRKKKRNGDGVVTCSSAKANTRVQISSVPPE